jgi:anaerobic selenocysteine-containing dehydrogenase
LSLIETACTYDCPDACGLLVEVDKTAIKIRGNPDHPITRGFVCQRIHRHPKRLVDPQRVTTPLVRKDNSWVEIDWDGALDLAAEKLQTAIDQHGPASVVHVQSGGSLGVKKQLIGHFFKSLGGVTTLSGGVCGDTGEAAQRADFGDTAGHDYTDLQNSQAIVLWGKNSAATSVHLIPFVKAGRERGVPVVLIDVQKTQTANFADRFISVAPSGDGFLALAVLRHLHDQSKLDPAAIARCENFEAFEQLLSGPDMRAEDLAGRAEVAMSDVEYLAELYSTARPLATHLGWGMQRRCSGGKNIRCIDALAALTSNVGVKGGGVTFTSWRRRGLDVSGLARASGRTIDMPTFGRDLIGLTDPPAQFVYISCANPVAQFADSKATAAALNRAGFVVLADAFLTDSADCADLFLPVSLMLEEDFDAVGSFNHHYVARVSKACDPPQGVREDVWIVNELNQRLGRPSDPVLTDPRAAFEKMIRPWFEGSQKKFLRNPCQQEVPYSEKFSTASGKMRLLEDMPRGIEPDPDYPLLFMTPKSRVFEHSQIRPDEQGQPATCYVHPEAPGALETTNGQAAQLVSPHGKMPVIVRHSSELRKDVCLVYVGGWLRFERAVNALVAARTTDMGNGTAYYDQPVRLETSKK